jgi:hypothetical protein
MFLPVGNRGDSGSRKGQSDNQGGQGRVDTAIQSRLGRGLRAVYRNVTGEPVPLEQIELLLALRRVERERRYSTCPPGKHMPSGVSREVSR